LNIIYSNRRLVLILFFLLMIGVAGASWFLIEDNERLIEDSAKSNAEDFNLMLSEFRSLYSSEVVDRVKAHGVEVTHDYINRAGAIPLPATMTKLLARHVGSLGHGESARLYSDYPFPWQDYGGELDAFEKSALKALQKRPNKPFYRREMLNGVDTFRYATADLMRQSCVVCHNSHPDSPKRDWKVGDLRGVLEVSFPISRVTEEASEDLLKDILFMIILTVVGLSLLTIFVLRLENERGKLEAEVHERTDELTRSERYYRSVVDNAVEGIITINPYGIIQNFNSSAEAIFGYQVKEVMNKNVKILMPEPFHSHHDHYLKNHLETGEERVIGIGREVMGKRKDGSIFPLHLAVSRVETDDGLFFVGLIQDITERKAAEEKIKKMAHYDHLTDIPNRALFNDRLIQAVSLADRNKQQIALLFIDLDGFKAVNDTLGHKAGDKLLQEVSRRLQECVRDADTVARLGGDEFVVLMADVNGAVNAAEKADLIIGSVAAPYPAIDESCRVGCSIGIALYPDDAEGAETLLNKADEAMYVVKKRGKNNHCFFSDLD